MEKSQSNKKRRNRRKNGRMVEGKNPWSLSRHQKKLHEFVFCNEGVHIRNFVKKKPIELLLAPIEA
jgi:hypothetical protein